MSRCLTLRSSCWFQGVGVGRPSHRRFSRVSLNVSDRMSGGDRAESDVSPLPRALGVAGKLPCSESRVGRPPQGQEGDGARATSPP